MNKQVTYLVYIKINTNNEIIAVNSSAFISDIAEWIEIDSGSDDNFHHAQNHYFDKPLMTRLGIYRYKYINNVVIEKSTQEIEDEEFIIIENQNRLNRINELKQLLFDTDYTIIKIAEGSATFEEYSDIIEMRRLWREEINRLEQG